VHRSGNLLALFLACAPIASGTSYKPPVPIVLSSPDGTCYAKSIPTDVLGNTGVTKTYDVAETDKLRDTYDWYHFDVYPWCWIYRHGNHREIGIVRVGKWATGKAPTLDDVAIAFYIGGELVKSYSVAELAGPLPRIRREMMEHGIFREVVGFKDFAQHPTPFEVTTIDGRRLAFSPEGEVLRGFGMAN